MAQNLLLPTTLLLHAKFQFKILKIGPFSLAETYFLWDFCREI